MTSIDERIKQELERDSAELDRMLAADGGVASIIQAGTRGSMGFLMKVAMVKVCAAGLLTAWLIYQFVIAATVDDRLFWGVWAILCGFGMLVLEIWLWMEAGRASTAREIKRLELAIAELAASLKGNEP